MLAEESNIEPTSDDWRRVRDLREKGLLGWLTHRERALLAGFFGVYLLGSLLTAFLTGVGHDEGFYAYIATLVYQGKTPYADFMFPQSPLVAYVYGLPTLLGGFHLIAMRLLSVAIGVVGVFCAWLAARRMGGPLAGLATAAGLALCMTFAGIVSPVTLTGTLVAAAILVLTFEMQPLAKHALAGALLALAAGVRLNAVVAIPILVLYAYLAENRSWRAALASALGAGVVLASTYAPFFAADAGAAGWDLVRYHTLDGRAPGMGIAALAKYKLDGLHYFVQGQFFLVTTFVFIAAAWLLFRRRGWKDDLLPLASGIVVLALVAANFTKVYIQPYYLAAVLPTLAMVVGLGLARALEALRDEPARLAVAGLAACIILSGAISVLPEQIVRNPPSAQPATLAEVGAFLQERVPAGGEVFALYPIYAAEAHRPASPGTEMGRLGYFPGMDNATADRYHVLNQWRMRELLASGRASAIVLQGGEWNYTTFPTAELPAAEQQAAWSDFHALVTTRYHLAREFGDVGVWLRNA